jgi:hypothetical protein
LDDPESVVEWGILIEPPPKLFRFMSGAATVLAASAGRSMLASTSTLELFTLPLFHPLHPLAWLSMRQRYHSAKLRQRTEQFARAVPQDLHSNAHQKERGEL